MTEPTHDTSTNTEIFDDRESEVRSYSRNWPVVFDTAKGATLRTVDGDEYLDFFGGAGVLNFGHNNPRMKQAMIEFLQADGVAHSLDTYTTTKRDFSGMGSWLMAGVVVLLLAVVANIFLQMSVLSIVITERLYRDHPELPEGQLAKMRSAVVNTRALAAIGPAAVTLALAEGLGAHAGSIQARLDSLNEGQTP